MTTNTPELDSDRYAARIAQVESGFASSTSEDARAIAKSIMTAGAIVAQAIDSNEGLESISERIATIGCRIADLRRCLPG